MIISFKLFVNDLPNYNEMGASPSIRPYNLNVAAEVQFLPEYKIQKVLVFDTKWGSIIKNLSDLDQAKLNDWVYHHMDKQAETYAPGALRKSLGDIDDDPTEMNQKVTFNEEPLVWVKDNQDEN